MRIDDTFTVAHSPPTVWRYVRQIPLVADCMPGAALLDHDEFGRFQGRFAIKLGPIAATFEGEGEAQWDDSAHAGAVRGQGRDGRSASRVQAELGFRLTPSSDGQATTIALSVDYTLTGALAQFGRSGIVTDIARRLTRDFTHAFEARINAELAADVPDVAGMRNVASAPAPLDGREPVPIDAGQLVWSVVLRRFSGWLCRLFWRR
jgi:carbon-monoxide dehydrogenase small subunit